MSKKIKIGKIVNAAGLKGEVKVYNYSASKERYLARKSIFIENDRYEIEGVRFVRQTVLLKLKGIDDRNAGEAVKGLGVFIDEADLPGLPEGEYYIRDMIGMAVKDDKGDLIGTLCDVMQGPAQDLYEVLLPDGRKILIPAVSEFILDINAGEKCINVKLIEGLI